MYVFLMCVHGCDTQGNILVWYVSIDSTAVGHTAVGHMDIQTHTHTHTERKGTEKKRVALLILACLGMRSLDSV